jgi:hypothetical protein
MAHDVRHGNADALRPVVQHHDGAAIGAEAEFQRAVRVLRVEGHPLDILGVVHLQVIVVEKATWVNCWPVTDLQTLQWHSWLPMGSALDVTCTCAQPPAYFAAILSSLND